MDVVQAIADLPRVKDNTASPFFQAGKAAGGALSGTGRWGIEGWRPAAQQHGIRVGGKPQPDTATLLF